jgi:multiple sugar transport system substrate-binding protein
MLSAMTTPRLVTSAFLVIMLSITLAGCRGGDRHDRVTIEFWHSFVSSTQPALRELIRRFEDEHPGIRIRAQYIPTGDGLVHKLIAAIRSNTAPDVSWVHADFLGQLIGAEALYPMEHFIEGADGLSEDELGDIFPALLDAVRYRDSLYAMPMEATLLALFYNRDLFRAAGLEPDSPPATWDELRRYTTALTTVNPAGRAERFGFYVPIFSASGPLNVWMILQWSPYLWAAGGELFSEDGTHALYNSDAGVRALTLWRDLHQDMGRPAMSVGHDAGFMSGHLAMIMNGPWDLPRFRQIRAFDWGVAPLPAGPAGSATYLAGEHLAIFRQSKHPKAAWTFVKWMIRPDVQAFFSAESGYLPVRRSTLDLPEYRAHLASDTAMQSFVDQIPLGRPRKPIERYQVEVNRHLADAIERVLLGGADPRQALDEAAARSNALLATPVRP